MASVKKAWIRDFGEEEGLRMWEEHKISLGSGLQNCIERFGEVEGLKHWECWKNAQKGKGSLQHFIDRYGIEEGQKLYLEKNQRLSVGEETLKRSGRTPAEIAEIRDQHSSKSKNDLQTLQQRYGEMEGLVKYKETNERKRIHSKRSLDFWLSYHDGDLEKAKVSLTSYQGKTLKTFTDLYGLEEGTEKYTDYVKRKTKNWKNYTYNHSKGQSEVESYIRSLIADEKIYGVAEDYSVFLKKAEQEQLSGNRLIKPDIILKHRKLVIEYYGNYWHGHQDYFPDPNARHPSINMTIAELRDRDITRIAVLENRGFKCLVIWESDWLGNQEEVKTKIRKVLNEIS